MPCVSTFWWASRADTRGIASFLMPHHETSFETFLAWLQWSSSTHSTPSPKLGKLTRSVSNCWWIGVIDSNVSSATPRSPTTSGAWLFWRGTVSLWAPRVQLLSNASLQSYDQRQHFCISSTSNPANFSQKNASAGEWSPKMGSKR